MSLSNQTNVVCPECNKNMVVHTWSSLNTAQNPEVKEEILRGDFGKIMCPKCGTRINLVYGFLYHDPVAVINRKRLRRIVLAWKILMQS